MLLTLLMSEERDVWLCETIFTCRDKLLIAACHDRPQLDILWSLQVFSLLCRK